MYARIKEEVTDLHDAYRVVRDTFWDPLIPMSDNDSGAIELHVTNMLSIIFTE